MKTLTQKQEKFCLNFIKCDNATKAALVAGYSPKTAFSIAAENLKKPLIISKIELLRKKAEDASVMSLLERRQRLTEIARSKLTDYMELGQDGSWVNIGKETPNGGAIQEIHSRTEYDENGSSPTVYTSVKLHDPIRAIQELNKMDGIGKETPAVTVNVSQHQEMKVIQYDSDKVAGAVIEGIKLGISPAMVEGNGHSQDTALLPASADLQATPVPESQN